MTDKVIVMIRKRNAKLVGDLSLRSFFAYRVENLGYIIIIGLKYKNVKRDLYSNHF